MDAIVDAEKNVAQTLNAFCVLIGGVNLLGASELWMVGMALVPIYAGAMVWVVTVSRVRMRPGSEKLVLIGAIIGFVANLLMVLSASAYFILVPDPSSVGGPASLLLIGSFNVIYLARQRSWLKMI